MIFQKRKTFVMENQADSQVTTDKAKIINLENND